MTLFCLIPLVLAGYAGTIQTSWHTSADISGPYVEAQTCKEGLGARLAYGHVNGAWVQVGPQYGHTWELWHELTVTLQVHGGLGYSNTRHPVTQVRQVTKWNGGAAVILGWKQLNIKAGFDHMSNGRGHDITNHGQDFWTLAAGVSF